ncbi:rod-binding protein [Pseudochelatococcus sp. G4_1912]|uniref:rod-binding protein n=1 Tax=Pseudochelatococcus sp. G4_1912 TaxID=3114288 RepID=UPI0039C684C0
MAVSLPADIVMDVARAADPARFRVAVNKLDSGSDYAAVANDVALAFAAPDVEGKTIGSQLPFDVERARLRLAGRDGFSPLESREIGTTGGLMNANRLRDGTPYQQFEALTLQKFVEAMLPKESSSWYGDGFAGDTWKSMLAQQVAAELARGGGIGIARMLEHAHPAKEGANNTHAEVRRALNESKDIQDKVTASDIMA